MRFWARQQKLPCLLQSFSRPSLSPLVFCFFFSLLFLKGSYYRSKIPGAKTPDFLCSVPKYQPLLSSHGALLQYDWCSWIPNAPPTMRCPPPTKKGTVTIEKIVASLPDRGRSCWHLGAVWALSQFQDSEVSQINCSRLWRYRWDHGDHGTHGLMIL